ncbi:hypothetical protein [Acidovorax delafieldii]
MSDSDIELECPRCGALVIDDELEQVDGEEDKAGCPCCGEASATEDWVS